jgi:hypothetical protein
MSHRGPQARWTTTLGGGSSTRLFAVSQGSFEGRFDALRDVHGRASLTCCTTFVNLGVIFVQTLDSHGRHSYGLDAFRQRIG